jgi:hypothetical protein
MKLLYIITPFLLLLASCATVEEAVDEDYTDEETEVVDDDRPDWYDYANRSYADTVSFVGIGLASSVNAESAREQAEKQAKANLRLAIDKFAEEIREELAEGQDGAQFSSAGFIINLRNTVHNLAIADDVELTTEHVEKENSVHHVYIKSQIARQAAIRALDAALQNDTFSGALNEREVL